MNHDSLPPLSPGMLVGGRYVLEIVLGRGGSSEVWAARHAVTNARVALKVLKATRPEHVRRFLREARIAASLEHPNVVSVFDLLEVTSTRPILVMERLHGETLAAHLAAVGRLSLAETARIFVPVIQALRAAHARGIVHRDLKPENVFLAHDGVRILDFGIAKLRELEHESAASQAGNIHTETGAAIGTPHYMPPEQVFGDPDLDWRADAWSLGVCLYRSLGGVQPFPGDNYGQIFKAIALGNPRPLREVAPELPDSVARMVHGLLTRDRNHRLSDLFAVERELERGLTRTRAPIFEPGVRWLAAALAVGFAACAVTVVSTGRSSAPQHVSTTEATIGGFSLPIAPATPPAAAPAPEPAVAAPAAPSVASMTPHLSIDQLPSQRLLAVNDAPPTGRASRRAARPASAPAAPVAVPTPRVEPAAAAREDELFKDMDSGRRTGAPSRASAASAATPAGDELRRF